MASQFVAFRVPCRDWMHKTAFGIEAAHSGIQLPYVFTLPCGVHRVESAPRSNVTCTCGNHLVVEFDETHFPKR